ncbi:MAG: MFS transporter [SAR202 cluster bacterium]|jgi:MFS family permease|nr:MAG: MFS transporter [SAR202 cluster bacterium]KAA1304118.1 MAG: MFS transporter [SAR202 cluster bacterium]MED5410141.1 MFS transporter [Chloroflexota bacterium]MED5449739.1 MFS transporter [Chloroflexota bacterium]|tara:strand:+ start:1411 stop:2718 length:1308 start_codon:yes stop_codon:yes gene_type:complete
MMELFKRATSWTPKTTIYYGWIVIAVGALGTYASSGSAQVTLAGIQTLIFEDTGWDRSTIALGITIGTWVAGLLTPVFGKIADTHGPRLAMPLTSLIVGVCFYWIGGMSAIWHFYVAYIIARGLGNPVLIGVMPRTVAVNFFDRKRNLALGIVSMARPCFGAINVQLITLISTWSSWRTAYKLLGVYSILLTIPLSLFIRKDPESIGLLPDGEKPKLSNQESFIKSEEVADIDKHIWSAREAAKTFTLWAIVSAEFLIILTSGTIGFQLVPYLHESGLPISMAALAWTISTLLNAFSNPIWGFLSDIYSPRKLVLSAMPICLVVTSIFLLIDGGYPGFACVVIWGAASGGLNVLGGMIIANYFGRHSFGSISGIMGPFQIIGLGLGPIIGAIMYDATGGYMYLFAFAIITYIAATILFFFAKPPKMKIFQSVENA